MRPERKKKELSLLPSLLGWVLILAPIDVIVYMLCFLSEGRLNSCSVNNGYLFCGFSPYLSLCHNNHNKNNENFGALFS
jgi:hypothetical protein